MFHTVLVANRGEIAARVMRTLGKLGVRSVAVYSEADRDAPHVAMADFAECLGPAPVDQSYLRADRILEAAKRHGAQAIHPGYGFLSENAGFAQLCDEAGIIFIGPTADQMRDFGLKHTARAIAKRAGVPLLPGTELLDTQAAALQAAQHIQYPVILKATAGGGGIGMRICHNPTELSAAFDVVRHLGEANFRSAGVYLERYVADARHIEVQIFGDGDGRVLALGERDCSTQRRNQKVIEETPAPGLLAADRARLFDAATRLGSAINYRSAGTVEFIYDVARNAFYFLEVNTRLQVEHGVTEQVLGIDLVEWMVRLAAGDDRFMDHPLPPPRGHSIQARLYAEDPAKDFRPSAGPLTQVHFPADCRIDTWVEPGLEVSPFYDPMLAKLIVTATTRDEAVTKLAKALDETRLSGIETNVDYLRAVVRSDTFARGEMTTRYLSKYVYTPATIDVLSPGNFTTIQDYPGRIGYWDVGVPPSGPMDHLSFRLGNRIVGNPEGAPGLELTVAGPTLRFNTRAVICLTGADMNAKLDGAPVDRYTPIDIPAGATLKLGRITGPGARSYLLIAGGLDVPAYLNSRSTFTLGQFGGHAGRTLRTGDVLHLAHEPTVSEPRAVGDDIAPMLTRTWKIGVMDGPHGSPDFFTDRDIEMLFATDWEVHYNSARTGVRLVGPKPTWARSDGGEAGLHPSNIHDNAYAIGTIDFTGDMPIILGPDGPSLGGFVCPATIVQAELWKIGQLATGDTVRFVRICPDDASAMEMKQDAMIDTLTAPPAESFSLAPLVSGPRYVWLDRPAAGDRSRVVYRRSGDRSMLIEYGPLVLDLDLRFRVHALMTRLQKEQLPGVIDLTPGIRSLQIHYDARVLPFDELVHALTRIEDDLPAVDDMEVEARIVRMPLSWNDSDTQRAIQKYMQSVRDDAPWCPSNIEFIRRINGLASVDDVKRIFFDASYLVLGLGDVYLGAPVATPMDPRHRLVTTKYNPARTWTPENAVGIGGAYLCIYGMEGPGGYQFVGRTAQVWNRWRSTADFEPGSPWLLRFFDQLRFYEVSHDELMQFRGDFLHGRVKLDVEKITFRLRDYHAFLESIRDDAAAFKRKQQAAFEAERAEWERRGEFRRAEAAAAGSAPAEVEIDVPVGGEVIESPMGASVWKVLVEAGARVKAGDTLAILEAMKMETPIVAAGDGKVHAAVCKAGQIVRAGQALFVMMEEA
ncbi:MAG: urea carboxylase [Planctomycetes bacterium]|nr:urea carboxylase [Planctomycetota bacterium]